jgi:hypothetical protein
MIAFLVDYRGLYSYQNPHANNLPGVPDVSA